MAATGNIEKVADWLRGLDPEQREQAIKQAQLLAAKELTDEELKQQQLPPISKLGDYLEMELPIPPEIVKPGIVVRGELHSLSSRAGKGKTTFTLNRFVRWAAARPMFDALPDIMAPCVEGGVKTLIIENEGSAGYFQERMRDIIAHGGYTAEETALIHNNIFVWGDGSYSGVRVDEVEMLTKLRDGVREYKPDIVFLDPFRSIWTGDENDGNQMNVAIGHLLQLCADFDCAVFMNHHEGKGKDNVDAMDFSRGSTVLEGAAATMERWTHVKGGTASEISWAKKRYGKKPAPVRMTFDYETWTYEHVGENEIDSTIIGVLGSVPDAYLTVDDVVEETGESARKVRDHLNKLAEDGRLQKVRSSTGPGFCYRINSDPDEAPTVPAGRLEVG